MPTIYVDQLEEALDGGTNPEKRNYTTMLKRCHEAGFPTRPLGPDDIQKLGTTRHQRWYAPEFGAARRESWKLGAEGNTAETGCLFKLDRTGEHAYWNAETLVVTDLSTGEVTRQPTEEGAMVRIAVDGDTVPAPLHHGPTKRVIAGQECLEWTQQSGTGSKKCLWSEGRVWGFSAAPDIGASCREVLGEFSIVLAEEPLDGTGCRISVTRMTVGEPLYPADYSPGSGVVN